MRNTILTLALVGSAIMGGIAGGNIATAQADAATDAAWDGVVVVRDGTLVANPAYYADHPEDLADAKVVIVSKTRAADAAAMREAL